MLEVKQSNEDKVWFDLDGKFLRFLMNNFSLFIGLKCVGDDQYFFYNLSGCRISDKNLSGNFSEFP